MNPYILPYYTVETRLLGPHDYGKISSVTEHITNTRNSVVSHITPILTDQPIGEINHIIIDIIPQVPPQTYLLHQAQSIQTTIKTTQAIPAQIQATASHMLTAQQQPLLPERNGDDEGNNSTFDIQRLLDGNIGYNSCFYYLNGKLSVESCKKKPAGAKALYEKIAAPRLLVDVEVPATNFFSGNKILQIL